MFFVKYFFKKRQTNVCILNKIVLYYNQNIYSYL